MNPEIQKLVDKFATHTIARKEATTAKDGNRHATLAHAAFAELVEKYGDDGREALTVLFDHDDPRIRVTAAAYLLRYKHEAAMAVLKELTKERGLVGFGAKQSIKNWDSGHWQLDPESSAPEQREL